MITIEPHKLLDLAAFVTQFPRPLGDMTTPSELIALLKCDAPALLKSDDQVRQAVRDLLRIGGFKPTGRSKPASEYLIKAAGGNDPDVRLGAINLAVDACNAVSLHSGLPISVIDLDLAKPHMRVAVAERGASYVFNATGQTIDLGGLLCLFDAEGPCGNAVKDAQRTKTSAQTRRTLSVIWGVNILSGRTEAAQAWYRELLHEAGAKTEVEEFEEAQV